ncbi:MAG: TIGR02186 family protein, partial [Nitrospirota bacterium]|nr:TIGR02186 family protein [Nitrospirota bacterium]
SGQASAELTAIPNHDRISIDFFYHGSSVSVRGVSDPDADLVIKISAPDGHQALRQKGKVGGLLWMNVGTINFENVPSLYFLSSSKKLDDILSSDEMAKDVLGYEALEKHVEMEPVKDENERAKWFGEFVKFKENSKLFSVSSGNITFSRKDGKQNYYTLFDWPYQAPPGEYTVTVYAVKNNRIVEKAESKVRVEQAGIVKSLAGMAKNNASVYGILSILAALGAGFGVGLIFRKGGGAH